MKRMIRSLSATISGFLMLGFLVVVPLTAHSAGLLPTPTGKCPEDYQNGTAPNLSVPCKDGGQRDYALDDIKSFLAIIGNFMLGVSGAIVLFCFVLGGFFWIASAGNEKMVSKGKGLISGAVIGLIIMFTAYTLVVFAVRTLTGTDAYKPTATGPGTGGSGGAGGGQNNAIIKGSISTMPLMVDKNALCQKLSGSACQKVNTCTTSFAITDACGTDAVSNGQECCMPIKDGSQTTPCGKMGGTCQDVSSPCNGPYVKGFCSGGNSTQCCFKVF